MLGLMMTIISIGYVIYPNDLISKGFFCFVDDFFVCFLCLVLWLIFKKK